MPTLNWIGKQAVIKHHQEVPYRLLEPVPELSLPFNSGRGGSSRSDERAAKDGGPGLSGEAGLRNLKGAEGAAASQDFGGNLIVQGDNLHALKALLPRYAGQVKCIYIDPPYNTGNEGWAYNDNVNSPEIRKWLGEVVGKEGETLDRHDRWLCMMYPRLVLLRQFLREDGAIFVSIDDNEVAALRMIMDEIFGASNFVENITWNKRIPKNDAGIGNIHEYVMVYRKNSSWNFLFTMKKSGIERVYQFVEKLKHDAIPLRDAERRLREFYRSEGFDRGITLYNSLDESYRLWGKINMSWPNANTFGPRYEILHPKTKKPVKIPDRGWRWKEDTFKQELGDGVVKDLSDSTYMVGRIWFDIDERTQPSSVKYLHEVDKILLRSILSMKSDGGIEVEDIFGTKAKFAYPKTTNLVQTLIASMDMAEGDIVFDSFAGSGTTGHAVLKQNAEDGGKRRFILVEMDEDIARSVTAERVKCVAQGYKNAKDEAIAGLGGGFQFCTLSKEPLFTAEGQIRSNVRFAQLAEFVWFRETGTGFQIPPIPPFSKWGKTECLKKGREIERVRKAESADPSALAQADASSDPPLKKGGDAAGGGGILSPLLGVHEGRAIYLLYNGILKDKSVNGGNVLTGKVLDVLPAFDGPKVVYAAACRLGESRLRREGIVFKQTPYALAV